MREEVRQFIGQISRAEQSELVHALIAGIANEVTDERTFLDADGVVVGYYVPYAKWVQDHPRTVSLGYESEEEASAAARNGPSLSEVIARLEAAELASGTK